MRLIRLFYEPYEVLSELRDASWAPAFVACIALSLLANFVVVKAIGTDVLMNRLPTDAKSKMAEPALLVALCTSRTALMAVGLLVMSFVMWLVLNFRRSSVAETGAEARARFGVVLAVCAYAAYAREAVRLIITLAAVSWHHFARVPLVYADDIKTNAAAFLGPNAAGPLFRLARSLDALMFGFLALAIVGLWKTIPNLRLQRANEVVLVSWVIYVGLAVTLGR